MFDCFIARFYFSCYIMCMEEKLIHYRTCVCNINYHMVWSVKYRRKILKPEIEEYLQKLVQQIAADKGFTVHLFECGECDHVHCFVSAPPKLSITAIVKYLKGITGRKLFERFPEIRNQLWKGELWNQSDLYLRKISAVIWNIRASHIDSRRNVNFHPQEHTRGEEECYCRIEHL